MKMLDCWKQTSLSLLLGCLVCLAVTSVVNADGRVFVLDLKNSTDSQGFRDAERACASLQARLASLAELRHAVIDCFFSTCTHGWLFGGTVGTTVCNLVGGAPKAVDVKTQNSTEDAEHLDAFCIKDTGVPCGDPPSFPHAHLQGHSGYDMGDELLYTCAPGYVMPSGNRAFSLLCDSCGEWYGMVEICIRSKKDETETHVDYEDKFTNSYGDAEHHGGRPEEAHGEVYEEVHVPSYPEEKMSQDQTETSLSVEDDEEHPDQHRDHGVGGLETSRTSEGALEGGREEQSTVEDFIGHPTWEKESRESVTTESAVATVAPVSILSQKHLFWFPSEAFKDEGHPVSTDPATQTTQRASAVQSEESKEHESQERYHHQHPVNADNHDDDGDDTEEQDRDLAAHDVDSHQDEEDHDEHYIPAQTEDLDSRGHHDNEEDHDDHYDMGEHEEDQDHGHYDSREFDDPDDIYAEHESHEDHVTDEHGDDEEHPDGSIQHPDQDDHDDDEEHDDHDESDTNYDDHDDHDDHGDHGDHDDHDDHDDRDEHDDHHDHHDHDNHNDHDDHHDHDDHDDHHDHDDQDDHDDRDDHHDHDDHDNHNDHDDHDDHDDHHDHDDQDDPDDQEQDDHVSHEDHDSHEDVDDGHQHVIFSIAVDENQNITQGGEGGKATTDETWLDGYPIVPAGAENEDSEMAGPEDTDRTNEAESLGPVPFPSSSGESLATEPAVEQDVAEEMWPGPTADLALDSSSENDTLDYDTQQVAPTRSWLGDLTEHPFIDNRRVPPGHDSNTLVEEHTIHHLPGESGERGGEMGEAICTGENCPPQVSSGRGPKIAAIIVGVCAVATAVIVGVWLYRRQQQKSSMYEMNGKGQSPTGPGQHIEMQQKL